MRVTRNEKSSGGIDLSPMLDVIFQLILFFLVSTTFATLPGISVNLPKSSTAQGVDVSGVTISIEENGKMWFNEEPTDLKKIDAQLSKVDLGKHTKDTFPITVTADENVKNGTIVQVFDALRKNGFVSVSLRTTERK